MRKLALLAATTAFVTGQVAAIDRTSIAQAARGGQVASEAGSSARPVDAAFAARCAALASDRSEGVAEAQVVPNGPVPMPSMMPGVPPVSVTVPAHCEIFGTLDSRVGVGRQHYAIRYHMRLPADWNGRLLFQGGGGLDGRVGDALGANNSGAPPALASGYAVVSQDSGHDMTANADPAWGGDAAFGRDPIARANYGGRSLKRVVDAAKVTISRFYGQGPKHSYFYGCSKGGQEGMAFAQRYPDEFDGIVAAAPGFALPRAALAQASDVQIFGSLVRTSPNAPIQFGQLPDAFTDAQLAHVRQAILDACDADDGLKDGIVGRFSQCTSRKVLPLLHAKGTDAGGGLSEAQIDALRRSLSGPRDATGRQIYADWPWDGGIGGDGWRMWKLGSARMPALNILTGGPALAVVFSVPPSPIQANPQSFLDWEMSLDLSKDADRINVTNAQFEHSAWTDISARSPDLSAFRAHGGKLIVPHGASDPVFSINDTLAWYRDVNARNGGHAAAFVRVFPVPGMNHCLGGPATDGFDALTALVAWVEQGRAPDHITAAAGSATPWPGRTRPLCAYPKVAIYSGRGSIEDADNFSCS